MRQGNETGRRMRRWSVMIAVTGVAAWLGVLPAHGEIGSDKPAAILVFPKLLVNTADGLDTVIRLSNISEDPINVLCFYVNATPRCTIEGGSCFPDKLACPVDIDDEIVFGDCLPRWQPTDFLFRLTRNQPTGWLVSEGETVNCQFLAGVCSRDGTTPCTLFDPGACEGPDNRCVLPPCLPLDGDLRTGPRGEQVNEGLVPPSPEDPFIGELKCIAVDEGLAPVARNDLIGEVLIGRVDARDGFVDVAGYNAIGIPAIPDSGNRDGVLVLGGPPEDAEYLGCPNILILDHFFDGAVDPIVRNVCQPDATCSVMGTPCQTNQDCRDNICVNGEICSVTGTECQSDDDCRNRCLETNVCQAGGRCSETDTPCDIDQDCIFCSLSSSECSEDADCPAPDFAVRIITDLTLIPCTQDFETLNLDLSRTVAQFLVFNEFEQRFSTSRTVECFREFTLSNIDTVDNSRSIFSAGVAGTLSGQSRIRGVVTASEGGGNGLLGVAEEFRCGVPEFRFPACSFVNSAYLVSSAAFNLHFQGRRPQSDFVYLPEQ